MKADAMKVISFENAQAFRTWLAKNQADTPGIWLRIFKNESGARSLTYAAALDQALCFGWIDGQKKSHDSYSWLQKFTPRRRRSGWSKKNTEHAERLIQSGEMTSSGLLEINAAKADGRWKSAYASFASAVPPAEFVKELAKNKKAQAFFKTLNKMNLYSIVYRLQTAKKPETRKKRMARIIKMLEKQETFH